MTAWLCGPVGAAEETVEDHFGRDWYYTEVVVFQRPQVQDHTSSEALAQQPAPLPRSLRSFLPLAGQRRGRALDPDTRACLTFPYLDLTMLPPDDELEVSDETAPDGVEPPRIEPRLAPDPLLDFLHQLAVFEAGLDAESYRWLAPETFTLDGEARRLSRAGGYQVLLHGRWLQPVPARDAPEALWVEAGPRYGDHRALEGTFEVTLGRYLHFRTGLYYTEPLLGHAPMNRAIPPPAAPIDVSEDAATRLSSADLVATGVMQLRESRRMRSDELHYLDHPKLGVLVRIEPVAVPESLSAAYAALEESKQ